MQCPLHADRLSLPISQRIYKACYGRFRPNNRDCHSGRWCYRGGWHQSYPPLIRQAFYTWQKPSNAEHLGSPYHTCVHCRGFAPAAPRRAGTSISVSLSGLPLSWPVRILGLVVLQSTKPVCFCASLHRQQPNPPPAHPMARVSGRARSRACSLSGITLTFARLSLTIGQVTDVLLSLSPPLLEDLHGLVESQ